MSVRSFRSLFMTGAVAGAALGCYLVSLRVASERAALEQVETQIVLAHRDIRLLQTEIGTRGRLAQLERWNVKVLALSAPSADQFLPDTYQLASMTQPAPTPAIEAPVVYASAPAEPESSVLPPSGGEPNGRPVRSELLHQASLKTAPVPPSQPRVTEAPRPRPDSTKLKGEQASSERPKTGAKEMGSAKPKPAATASAKVKDSPPAVKPKSAETKLAQADPLAPLPSAKGKPSSTATAKEKSKTR